MNDIAGIIADELASMCVDGYVEKHEFKDGIRYIIRPSDMFIELHVVSEGGDVCVEIWDNSISAAPIFSRSFHGLAPDELIRYVVCRIYRLLMHSRVKSGRAGTLLNAQQGVESKAEW